MRRLILQPIALREILSALRQDRGQGVDGTVSEGTPGEAKGGCAMTALHRLLLNLLKHGPQSLCDLLEMWRPHTDAEFAEVAGHLKAFGLIAQCEHCERIWTEEEMGSSMCPECRARLLLAVLSDRTDEGGMVQ
jgi:hypothetical protein